MIESAMALAVYAFIIVFIFEAGVLLYYYSTLITSTEVLTHFLAIRLGQGMSSGVAGGPCSTFLNAAGTQFLAHQLDATDYSMTDTSKRFSYSASIVAEPSSPYAILRVVGTLRPTCLPCRFFPGVAISSESSSLVEFQNLTCS